MRECLNFNFDWRFHRGDITRRNWQGIHEDRFEAAEWLKAGNHGPSKPGYPDGDWRRVDLPHDFVIEGEFTQDANLVQGSLPKDVGWYRKTFSLPAEDQCKRLCLEFDGVYRDCQVWVNGHFIGRHLSGYTSFAFDITDVCRFGDLNCVAIRADAREYELWSYEGGGVYRDVRLVKTHPVHIGHWGTYVRADLPESGDGPADLTVQTTVRNDLDQPVSAAVALTVVDAAGNEVAKAEHPIEINAYGETTREQGLTIAHPERWELDRPYLYRLISKVVIDGHPVDETETSFGLRTLRFDSETGFYLNGKPTKLKGVCNHQDHAGVGMAIPYRLQEWRVEQLKKMGCNAIRTSHNPPTPALLDICDRLGVMVMSENRLLGTSEEMLGQLSDLVRRDRNHPCVFAWSLGNEEMVVQHTEIGVRQMKRMQDLCHSLDPSRPVTYAMNCNWNEIADFHHEMGFRLDVFGANYVCRKPYDVDGKLYDEFHAKYPDWPMLGSETGGSASVRGLYQAEPTDPPVELEKSAFWRNPKRKDLVSAYGETCTPWGDTVEVTWKDCVSRPFMAGTFLWTGFDYRGETYPHRWPAVITSYGLMDLCGFPKDACHYYRVWWNDEPSIHLFPHWDWRGREGETIEVWCYCNCAEVELLLNGRSLGRKPMPPYEHVAWEVAFEPGKLEAIGYDSQGKAVVSCHHQTPSNPAAVSLSADRNTLRADREDLAVVTVRVVDDEGRACDNADHLIHFDVEGPGRIIGVGNGNPFSHEPDKANHRRLYHGLCQVLLQTTHDAGEIKLIARSDGLKPCELTLQSQPTSGLAWVASVDPSGDQEDLDQVASAVDNAL